MRKELSGLFLSPERWHAALQDVAGVGGSTYTSVKLFHNEPSHTSTLLQALAHPQCQVQELDLYTLEAAPDSAGALQAFLSSPQCLLTRLSIQACQGQAAAVALGAGLASQHCKVQVLSLTGMSDAELAATLQPLAQQQAGNNTRLPLLELTLTRCTLGHNSTIGSLAAWSSLQHLALTDCLLSDAQAQSLVSDVLMHPAPPGPDTAQPAGLKSLSLCGTQIAGHAAQAISGLLAQPWCQLSQLTLNNSPNFNDHAAQQLAVGLHSSRYLQCLKLSQCAVGPTGAQALAAAITGHPSLQELWLDHNQVGAAGMMALLLAATGQQATSAADTVQPGGQLRVLVLEANNIRGADLPSWPEVTPGQAGCELRQLGLAHNYLSDVGVQLVQQALAGAHQLSQLDLEGCGVGTAGAAALVNLLSQHPSLRDLRLDHNRLHDAGAKLLLPAVQAHPGLVVFRAEACRLIDVVLKTSVANITQQLAARGAQQAKAAADQQAGGETAPARVNVRMGTRFPAAVYQQGRMGVDGCPAPHMAAQSIRSGEASGSGQSAALPPRSGPRRIGSRFAPEAYRRPVVDSDSSSSDGSPRMPSAGGEAGDADMPMPPCSPGNVCGKHTLGVEERAEDPRASKDMREQQEEGGAAEGGGSQVGSQHHQMHPFRDGAAAAWRNSHTGDQQPSMYGDDSQASSFSMHSYDGSSLSSSLSLSPRFLPGCTMQTACSAQLMHLESNHSTGHAPVGLQSYASQPLSGYHRQPSQQGVTCLVLRPSAKRRSYKPLTPQQQAMFDVF